MPKISKGLQVIGWALLIINAWGFLVSFNFNGIIYLTNTIRPYGIIFFSITLIMFLLQITASIYLLRLKEFARKAMVLLMFLNILLLILQPIVGGKTSFLSTDDYVKQHYSTLSKEQILNYQKLDYLLRQKSNHQLSSDERSRVGRVVSQMYLPSIVIFTAWYLFLIFFLNRPGIKLQFS